MLEPLCHLMIWLSPLVWLMNWLSYLNGSAHRSTGAARSRDRDPGQLDFCARLPAAGVAGGAGPGHVLAMFPYDATATLPTIPVPALVVAGEADTLCMPEASEHGVRDPRRPVVTLDAARHAGLFERHEVFDAAVAEFASGCLASRPAASRGASPFVTAEEVPSPRPFPLRRAESVIPPGGSRTVRRAVA